MKTAYFQDNVLLDQDEGRCQTLDAHNTEYLLIYRTSVTGLSQMMLRENAQFLILTQFTTRQILYGAILRSLRQQSALADVFLS